jgi:hypothetical protein
MAKQITKAANSVALPARISWLTSSVAECLRTPMDAEGRPNPSLWVPRRWPMRKSDLDDAVAALTELLKPAGSDGVRVVLADLMITTQPPSTEGLSLGQIKAIVVKLIEDYIPFLVHVPADILLNAARQCAERSKFYPKPAELLEFATPAITERHDMRRRAEQQLRDLAKPQAKPFVQEPLDVRLRHLRDVYARHGNLDKANHYERDLAKLENREPVYFELEQSHEAPSPPQEQPAP